MPYTLGDIMETEHAQLWDDIKSFTNECISLQERVIGMMPNAKSALPQDVEGLKDEESEKAFQHYILLLSIYRLTKECIDRLNEQCAELCKRKIYADELEESLALLKSYDFDSFVADRLLGLMKLHQKNEESCNKLVGVYVLNHWSFRDITVPIATWGIAPNVARFENLLKDLLAADIPTATNIEKANEDESFERYIY